MYYPPPTPVPSETPVVNRPVYNSGDFSALVTWSPISDDQWNGIMLNYVVVVADFTAQPVRQHSFLVDVEEDSLLINSLTVSNTVVCTVLGIDTGTVYRVYFDV